MEDKLNRGQIIDLLRQLGNLYGSYLDNENDTTKEAVKKRKSIIKKAGEILKTLEPYENENKYNIGLYKEFFVSLPRRNRTIIRIILKFLSRHLGKIN
jgi:hypothetical protein